MKNIDTYYKGARIALATGSMQGVMDFAEIERLNTISTTAWLNGNNSGNPAYLTKMEAKSDRAWEKAKKIAEKNGWRIEAPGLYWHVAGKDGQEIR